MSYTSTILADTPVSYWPLADTTTTATDSSDANNGTYNGTYTQSQTGFGLSGNGTLFDGSSGYISVPDATNLHITSVSLEALIKTTSSASHAPIIAKYNISLPNAGFGLRVSSGTLSAWAGSGAWISSGRVVNDGSWHHAVVTISSSGVLSFYIDGIFISSTTIAQSFSNIASLNIARSPDVAGFFPGTISNVAIYDYVLIASQVATHYDNIGTSGNIRETQQPLRAIYLTSSNNIRSTQQPLRVIVTPTNNIRSTQLALRVIHQNLPIVSQNLSNITQEILETLYSAQGQSLLTQEILETLYSAQANSASTQLIIETLMKVFTGSLILVPMNGLNRNSQMTGGMN